MLTRTSRRNQGTVEFQQAANTLEAPVPVEFAREFQVGNAYQPLPDDFMDRVVAQSLKVPARVWRAAWAGLLAADDPALGRREPTKGQEASLHV